jgi:hypothetical protein
VKSNQRNDFIFRPVGDGGFGLVLERRDDGTLVHQHIETVTANDAGLDWVRQPVAPQRGAVAAAKAIHAVVQQHWTWKRTHIDSDDVSFILTALMNGSWKRPFLGAFSLRERQGGVYFVPASTLPHLRALKDAIEQLSPGIRIQILTVSGTGENLAEAASEARKSLGRQLAEVRDEAEALLADLKHSKKAPDSRNLAVRSDRFRALAARANLFQEILGDWTQEIQEPYLPNTPRRITKGVFTWA